MCKRIADSIVETKRAGLCTHTYAEAEQRKLIVMLWQWFDSFKTIVTKSIEWS